MLNISFSETGLILPPTTLRDAPALARRAGVARVLVKLENERPLGNFKILGGMYAGVRVLADCLGLTIDDLIAQRGRLSNLPRLICASDGNHGLAVAAAACAAGAPSTIYLHLGVDAKRAQRIQEFGASINWIQGTYDDSVDEAAAAAKRGEGCLVPDTTSDPHCRVVRYVMDGYSTLTSELVSQFEDLGVQPTNGFIQAGVGGLVAAVAEGLESGMRNTPAITIVEPENAACVGLALATGELNRVAGDLVTSAEMLSCGLASAPALRALRRHSAQAVAVDESQLADAVRIFADDLDIETSPSGAAGLAGLLHVAENGRRRNTHALSSDSTVLLIVTEAAME